MICIKCKREVPDGPFCCQCGAEQERKSRKALRRGNGKGTVYRLQGRRSRPYTDLAYTAALGRTARQLRKERGADKGATASDYMNADELAAVASMENRISVLLDVGMSYQQIKNSLLRVKRLGA